MEASPIKFNYAHAYPCDCSYTKDGSNVVTCGSDCSVFEFHLLIRLLYMIQKENTNYYCL